MQRLSSWDVNLHVGLDIFDNIYSLALYLSIHNAISGMIMLDLLKYPMLSDVLNLLYVNGVSKLIRIY